MMEFFLYSRDILGGILRFKSGFPRITKKIFQTRKQGAAD